MRHYVIGIDHRHASRRNLVGGKASGLARLRSSGFNVPDTSIITIPAIKKYFEDQYQQLKPDAQIGSPGDWDEQKFHLPPKLEREILKAYGQIGTVVAVRSSMREEDGEKASFAGQLDSFLNVEGEQQLISAVKKCCHALINSRLQIYLKQIQKKNYFHLDPPFSLAVIIQQMVPAVVSGVAFSYDPFNQQSCIIIEAGSGLGNRLVDGKVNPDRYLVDLDQHLVEMQHQQPEQSLLTSAQILELAGQVQSIASKFMQHQDIEWAWDGYRFYFLQTRPITYPCSGRMYSSKLVADMTPGLIKPLLWSTNILDMTVNVFGRIFTKIIGPNTFDFTSLIKRIHSRVYSDLAFFSKLFEYMGLPANFFEIIARDEIAIKKKPEFSLRFIRTLFRLVFFIFHHARIKPDILSFITRHEDRLNTFRYTKWTETELSQLFKKISEFRTYHADTQWFMWIGALNMTVRNKLLTRMVKKNDPQVRPENLISGLVGLKSLEPNRELKEMANQARRVDPESREKILQGANPDIRASLEKSQEGRKLLTEFDQFMSRFGFLSINGTDFSYSPWIENPEHIWKGIARLLSSTAERSQIDVQKIRQAARHQVESGLNWSQRPIFHFLLRSTTEYIQLREKMTFFMSENAYQMRRLYLEIGRRFKADHKLDDPEDIFFLYFNEIRELIDDSSEAERIRGKITLRKAEMDQDRNLELNEVICTDSPELHLYQPVAGKEYLTGITGSPGIIKGLARVVLDPAEISGTFTREDILVVPFTDVGWTPLFPSIGGIVAETGGQLSHSSIIAREYGLPAVVGVRMATRIIKNGQPLLVDANQGKVYLNI